jgi:hypothetical protein
MKQIKITESELKDIISESVIKALNESDALMPSKIMGKNGEKIMDTTIERFTPEQQKILNHVAKTIQKGISALSETHQGIYREEPSELYAVHEAQKMLKNFFTQMVRGKYYVPGMDNEDGRPRFNKRMRRDF